MTENATIETSPSKPSTSNKTLARIMAVIAIYHRTNNALEYRADQLEEYLSFYQTVASGEEADGSFSDEMLVKKIDKAFFKRIVNNSETLKESIEQWITGCLAPGWTLSRLGSVDRAILYAGTYELLGEKKIPAEVIPSEYVKIAELFLEGAEVKFINAILDSLSRKVRS